MLRNVFADARANPADERDWTLRAELDVWIAPAQLAAVPEHVVTLVIKKPLPALAV